MPQCNIQKRDVGEEITATRADLDIPCSNGGLVSEEMPRWRLKPRREFLYARNVALSNFLLHDGQNLRLYILTYSSRNVSHPSIDFIFPLQLG